MNWKQLLESFTDTDFNELNYAVSCEARRRAGESAKNLPNFNIAEIDLIKSGSPIQALKAYRERTGSSLMEAKSKYDELIKK